MEEVNETRLITSTKMLNQWVNLFLILTYPDFPGQRAVKWVVVLCCSTCFYTASAGLSSDADVDTC